MNDSHPDRGAAGHSARWLAAQNQCFASALDGAPVEGSLELLAAAAVDQLAGSRCAFYLEEESGAALRLVASAPGRGQAPASRVELRAGDGLAAPQILPDIQKEPRSDPLRQLAEAAGHRSLWSFPVQGSAGHPAGIALILFDAPSTPGAAQLAFARSLCATAAIIVGQGPERSAPEPGLATSRSREHGLSRPSANTDSDELLESILDLASDIMRSDFAAIHLIDGERGGSRLVASRNFGPGADSRPRGYPDGPVGPAQQQVERRIVADLARDRSVSSEQRAQYDRCGIRSFQSTPLKTVDGLPVGTISTYWRGPHRPADSELRQIDLLARQSADALERYRAQKSLRESRAQYRALFESMDEAYAVVEVLKDRMGQWDDFRFLEVNPAFMGHTGMPYPVGKTAREILGTPNPRWAELYGKVVDSGRPTRIEETEATLGRTFDLNLFALDRDRNRIAVLFTDVTERRRAEGALRQSEERKAFLLKLSDALSGATMARHVMETSARLLGDELEADRTVYSDIEGRTGRRVARLVAQHVRRGAPLPDSVEYDGKVGGWVRDQLRRGRPVVLADAAGDPRLDEETRALLLDVGIRALLAVPLLRDGLEAVHLGVHQGEPRQWSSGEVELVGDVAERTFGAAERLKSETMLRAEKRRQETLLAELQHRVRNTLAVVRSIVRRTGATSASFEEFERHLDGRLTAFARTQAYVTRDPEGSVDLELILRDELIAHAAGGHEHIRIRGPQVRLNAKQAETLGLAIHELTSNAIKHGALASDGNRIDVHWSLSGGDEMRTLTFAWREQVKDRQIPSPGRSGFGTELLERVLSYELDATTAIEFRPDGFSYRAEIPLPDHDPRFPGPSHR